MSKSGFKYVPVLDAVKSLVDVNEKGMKEHSRKPEVLPLLNRSLEGSYQIIYIFVSQQIRCLVLGQQADFHKFINRAYI